MIIDISSMSDITIVRGKKYDFNESITTVYWNRGELDEDILDLFPNLSVLYCDNNGITSLKPISKLYNLTQLYCCMNQIISLEPISKLYDLTKLFCRMNQIISLEHISKLKKLTNLEINNNKITSLEPVSHLTNLEKLLCDDNQIVSLEPVIYLTNLMYISYRNNPLQPPTIQITRFLNRVGRNTHTSIFYDNKHYYEQSIQRSMMWSIQNLLRDPKPLSSLNSILESSLSQTSKTNITEYYHDTMIHSILLINYQELMDYVWQRIENSNHREELIEILDKNIKIRQKYLNKRFVAIISILQDFFDDINIRVNPSEIMLTLVLSLKEENDGEILKSKIENELTILGYPDDEIQPWLDALD